MSTDLTFKPPPAKVKWTGSEAAPDIQVETKIYKIDVQIGLSQQDNHIANVYTKFLFIVGRLLFTGCVEIIPIDEESEALSIADASEVPTTQENIMLYCHKAHLNPKKTAMYFLMRIKTIDRNFKQIKDPMVSWLRNNRIWLRPTRLNTSINCVIGWLKNSHAILYHRQSIQFDLKTRCQIEEDFQLITRTLFLSDRSTKTTALVIECTREDSRTIEGKLIAGLQINNPGDKYLASRDLLYITMAGNDDISTQMIDRCILHQINSNKTLRRIKVNNASHLDET